MSGGWRRHPGGCSGDTREGASGEWPPEPGVAIHPTTAHPPPTRPQASIVGKARAKEKAIARISVLRHK